MAKSNDMYVRNEVFLGWHRAVYGVIALAVLALLVLKTRVVEAFLAFCFAGVIPGTDVVVPPDVVFWAMVGMAVATVAGSWLKIKITRARRQRHFWRLANAQPVTTAPVQIAVQTAEEPAVALPVAVDPVPVRYIVPKRSMRIRFMLVTVLRSLGDVANVIGLTVRKVSLAIAAGSRATAKSTTKMLAMWILAAATAIAVACRALGTAVAYIARSSYRGAKRTGRWTAQTASDIWQWAEPMLWKLDERLELVVRNVEQWSARKLLSSLSVESLVDGLREYKKSLAILTQPPLPKPLPRQATKVGKVSVPLHSAAEPRNK